MSLGSGSGSGYVAVVGGGDAVEAPLLDLAEQVGRGIASHGRVLVCGGLGGVMEAACRGARDAGGTTLGLLPGHDRTEANPYVSIALATGLGEGRNALLARVADAMIAVGGGYGTLSEIALALRRGIPVIGLETWELAIGGRPDRGVLPADSAQEAVERALSAAVSTGPHDG